jgi:PAS domain S-box-containing protein
VELHRIKPQSADDSAGQEPQNFSLSGFSAIIALSAFSKFLESSQYHQWRALEMAGIFDATAIAVTHALMKGGGVEKSQQECLEQSTDTYAKRAFFSMEKNDILQLTKKSTWLSSLIAAVECLPMGFSIATADPARHGFPLIYVNKKFEHDTGYSRDYIIGKNCKFLQGKETNKKTVRKIHEALRDFKPVTAILINYRADGSTYRNLITLKPLFDQDGNVRYIIALQVVMEKSEQSLDLSNRVDMMNRLMSRLPDNVVVQEESSNDKAEEIQEVELV